MSEQIPVEEFSKIESLYVRHRNALVIRGQFTPIFTDHYLNLMQHEIRHAPDLDAMLKDLLAGLTLHLVARPWAENIAWTVNLRAPRVNFFVTGASLLESVTGRLFTEDVREPDRNFFYSQTTTQQNPEPRTSTLQVDGNDPLFWIEQYYTQSEQRPARLFRHDEDIYTLVAAQPDYDEEWLAALDSERVASIRNDQETKLLETRRFKFHCGCDLDKILPILGGWKKRPEELFEGADQIIIQCPRCAARYPITRDML